MAWPATTTTIANLNLRSSPSTTASILGVMPNGGTITVTGAPQNGWYPVTYNGQSGWASAQYITPPPTTPTTTTGQTLNTYGGNTLPGSGGTPTGGGSTPYAYSTTSTQGANLNLRSGTGTQYSVIGSIPDGTRITITGPAVNGWIPVTYNGRTGYVSAQYVNPFTPNPTTNTTPPPTTGTTPPPGGGTGTTPPPSTGPNPPIPPPQSVPAGQPQNPNYDPGSTYGSTQNWYNTPIVSQSQDFGSEWEKSITQQGYGGFGTKSNIARNLIERAQSGFGAATMNNPNLTPRDYINQHLGPNYLRNAMAQMTPSQRGEMPGIFQPRARWNER
jgi:uncharacterized protein YraI